MLEFDILTIFPNIFDSYFSESIIKRAQKRKLVKIKIHNLRDYTTDKHRTVDDAPYGGGAGMVMKVEPIYKALHALKSKIQNPKSKVILLSPKGRQFNQRLAERFSNLDRIILICGRYEGVDERVSKFVDKKISIGPYVLTGGELPVMIIVDVITRLIPGVIKKESLEEETFSFLTSNIQHLTSKLEYPQYTRPEIFEYRDKFGKIKRLRVPKVLLSGDHKKIKEWRERHSKIVDK